MKYWAALWLSHVQVLPRSRNCASIIYFAQETFSSRASLRDQVSQNDPVLDFLSEHGYSESSHELLYFFSIRSVFSALIQEAECQALASSDWDSNTHLASIPSLGTMSISVVWEILSFLQIKTILVCLKIYWSVFCLLPQFTALYLCTVHSLHMHIHDIHILKEWGQLVKQHCSNSGVVQKFKTFTMVEGIIRIKHLHCCWSSCILCLSKDNLCPNLTFFMWFHLTLFILITECLCFLLFLN